MSNVSIKDLQREFKTNEKEIERLQNRQKQLKELFRMIGTVTGSAVPTATKKPTYTIPSGTETRIHGWMQHGKIVTPESIARKLYDTTNPEPKQVRAAANFLRNMTTKGLVTRVSRGKYRIVKPVETAKMGSDTTVTRINPTPELEGGTN